MAAPVSSSAGLVPVPECTGFICSIYNRISLQQVGCGIIVRLKIDKNDTTAGNIISMRKFIKLIPALSKCGAIDSTWILLTSHSVTDGSPDSLSNLKMSLHCRRHSGGYTMGDNVKSAISCCGPKSLIGPGNISDPRGALRSHMLSEACAREGPHDGICSIELGFTICFLNSNFVRTILERVNVRPYAIDVANCSSQAAIFENYTIYWENGFTNELRQSVSTNSRYRTQIQENGRHQAVTIRSGMESFKKNMHLQYPENEAPPGAVLMNSKGAPVGIHIGKMKKDGVEITGGLNIYSVIELLRGGPAPTLALVTMPEGRRIWCNKWKHLLIPFLESQFINGGYALDLNLEITQILFENENFRISINDPTEFRTGVMQMMSAITKNLRFFSRGQINAHPQSPTLINYINKLYDEVCNFLSASQELWIHEASITEMFHLAKNMVYFKLADTEKVKQLSESLKSIHERIREEGPFEENIDISECYFNMIDSMNSIYGTNIPLA